MADQEQPGDFGPTWVLLRVLPESNEHPGTPAVRMRRALKGLLRGYGIRVEQLAACAPDGWPAGIRPPKWPRP
jgi:hypothetical protein